MQNGRNRIAAHGRTKAGFPVATGKRARRRQRGLADAKAPALTLAPTAKSPAFPPEVAVALPPGVQVAAVGVEKPKDARKPRANPAQGRRRKPGRKKRAAAREAATVPGVAAAGQMAVDHAVLAQNALVATPPPRKAAPPPRHPVTPEVIHLAYMGTPVIAAALPLPVAPEPLVVPRSAAAPAPDLPRGRAPAAPRKGLVAAIADWIRSARRLTLLGLLPRKTRAPLPKPPTHLPPGLAPRPPSEMERLRRENEALRKRLATLEAIETLRTTRNAAEA